jgi:indole-3-glycerol phosphate synthase
MNATSRARSTVLDRIVASTREELARRKRMRPSAELAAAAQARAGNGRLRFRDALAGPGISVIAEFKRRSPSAGVLRERADVRALARAYERGGASAVSVLTEGEYFDGSLDDLRAARASCDLPLLRKDFIIDDYQLYEACESGADAVLLIAAALDDAQLGSLHRAARALALDALVEVHTRRELKRALAVGAELVGINNRDLRDFTVDVRNTLALMADMPPAVTVVSESGIDDAQQLKRLEKAGVHAVLIGEALMRAANPVSTLETLLCSSEHFMKPDGGL